MAITTLEDYFTVPVAAPFPDSICGKFHVTGVGTIPLHSTRAGAAIFDCSAFQGSSKEMYHVEGVLQIYRNNIQFKGVEGMRGLTEIVKSLSPLYDAINPSTLVTVHNAIFTFRMGTLITTESGGHFVQWVQQSVPGIEFIPLPFGEEMYVCLKLVAADALGVLEEHFPASCVPTIVDFKVRPQGTVQAWLLWVNCPWDQAMEDTTSVFLSHISTLFRACCKVFLSHISTLFRACC